MSDAPSMPGVGRRPRGLARWTAELGIAVVLIVAGALIVNGSLEQGVSWTSNGPESGYFPLRIGWLLVATGLIQSCLAFAMAIKGRLDPSRREIWLAFSRAKPLLQVFIPTVAYVIAVPWLGLYIASALFIGAFMWWHGRYSIRRATLTSIAICACLYVILEIWFKVELYHGPLIDSLVEILRH